MAGLQLHNPLTKELRSRIEDIPGVKRVYTQQAAHIRYDYRDQSGNRDSVRPFTEKNLPKLQEKLTEGRVDYDELLKGDKILVCGNDVAEEIFGWRFQTGDNVTLSYYDGKAWKSRTYKIAGAVETAELETGITDGWFLLPEQVLERELQGVNRTNEWIVSTEEKAGAEIEKQLEQLLSSHPKLSMSTLRQHEEQSAEAADQLILEILSLTIFITLFSMLNLINTLMTRFMSQKTELAMLQSIGMTGPQTGRMIMGEGLVLAAGNIVMSLTAGPLLGYGVCRLFQSMGARYMDYQFPVSGSLLYAAAVLLIPCVISLVMLRRSKSRSLVERLREV